MAPKSRGLTGLLFIYSEIRESQGEKEGGKKLTNGVMLEGVLAPELPGRMKNYKRLGTHQFPDLRQMAVATSRSRARPSFSVRRFLFVTIQCGTAIESPARPTGSCL